MVSCKTEKYCCSYLGKVCAEPPLTVSLSSRPMSFCTKHGKTLTSVYENVNYFTPMMIHKKHVVKC